MFLQVVPVENSHGVHLYVSFEHGVLDFARRVAAAIVAPIGNDDDRLAEIAGVLHLHGSHMDGIQQRSPSERAGPHDAAEELVGILRERNGQPRTLVELDQEEFVLWIRGLEESRRGFGGPSY